MLSKLRTHSPLSPVFPLIVLTSSVLAMSSIAHTFMARGPETCRCLFCCDRGCIAAGFSGISLTVMLLHARRYPPTVRRWATALILATGTGSAFGVATGLGGRKWAVVLLLAAQMTLGTIPVLSELTLTSNPALRRIIVHHLVASTAWGALGGVVFSTLWPERTAPGRFDLVGTSHNIMHVCVVFSLLAAYRGCTQWTRIHDKLAAAGHTRLIGHA